MVTKPAMMTTKMARRISLGMILRMAATTTLQQVRMMRTDRPMPTPLNRVVVIAMVAHMPISCTRTGLLVIRPSLNCFLIFIQPFLLNPEIQQPRWRLRLLQLHCGR